MTPAAAVDLFVVGEVQAVLEARNEVLAVRFLPRVGWFPPGPVYCRACVLSYLGVIAPMYPEWWWRARLLIDLDEAAAERECAVCSKRAPR